MSKYDRLDTTQTEVPEEATSLEPTAEEPVDEQAELRAGANRMRGYGAFMLGISAFNGMSAMQSEGAIGSIGGIVAGAGVGMGVYAIGRARTADNTADAMMIRDASLPLAEYVSAPELQA